MFASMRSKKKPQPATSAGRGEKTDQKQEPVAATAQQKRPDALPPPQLQLPEPLRYYPGTHMPVDGWFHACR
jgi:hypothetical protein